MLCMRSYQLQSRKRTNKQLPVCIAGRLIEILWFYPKNTLPVASDRAGCCHGHALSPHPLLLSHLRA